MPVNQTDNKQLTFLQEKIHQIGSAIFYNQSDSVLKLPTSLVSTIKVDEFGYIWFFIKKPYQNITEFENDFPVKMDFFRKGVDFFLQVYGKGWAVTDPEEMYSFIEVNDDIDASVFNEMVLVKVKMMKAECFETQPKAKASWWQAAVQTVYTWFGNTNNVGRGTFYPAS